MRTFISVIGASAGVVILVFLVVASVLYWSTPDTPELADAQQPSATDSLMATQPPVPKPPALTPPKPQLRPVQAKTVRVKDTAPKPTIIRQPSKQTTQTAKKKPATPAMTTEEFLAREVHYIGKIQKDAEEVIARSADTSAKMAALNAELDDLLLR